MYTGVRMVIDAGSSTVGGDITSVEGQLGNLDLQDKADRIDDTSLSILAGNPNLPTPMQGVSYQARVGEGMVDMGIVEDEGYYSAFRTPGPGRLPGDGGDES